MSSDLKQLFTAKLATSGLTPKDADKLGFELLPKELIAKLGHPAYGGFKIPYHHPHGKPTGFYRIRYLEQTKTGFKALTDAKPLRYVQPKATLSEVYLPRFIDWAKILTDASKPLIITEGELKAAKACKEGFAVMALGGVWNFRSTANNIELLELLDTKVVWKDRVVVLCYDSDALTNPNVGLAEHTLAKLLVKRGADVHVGRIPAGRSKDGEQIKVGIDDLLVEDGKQALREVLDKAYPFGPAQELFKLNTEVMYVRNPGLILRLDNLQRMATRAFTEHAYATRTFTETTTVEGKKGAQTKIIEKSAPKEWLKWPARAEVEKVTYLPGKDRIFDGCLNVWGGWGVQPEKGDVTPWLKLLDWIFKKDDEAKRWFIQWCAYPLQYPGTKLCQSVVLWGIHNGTGKSLIGSTLFRIYGENCTLIKDNNLSENHNEWAENKQFVMGDDVTGGDKRGIADKLKSLITQEKMRLNPKYVPSYEVPDCINYYFTSNHPDSFFLEDNDRRYFVWEVEGAPLDRTFYRDYAAWMNNGGVKALFAYLLEYELRGFDPYAPAPMTNSKSEMIYTGKSDLGVWVDALKKDPESTLRIDDVRFSHKIWRSEDLLRIYDPDVKTRVTANGIARELKRAGFKRVEDGIPIRTAIGQVRLWLVRNHADFAKMHGDEFGRLYDEERGFSGMKLKKRKF